MNFSPEIFIIIQTPRYLSIKNTAFKQQTSKVSFCKTIRITLPLGWFFFCLFEFFALYSNVRKRIYRLFKLEVDMLYRILITVILLTTQAIAQDTQAPVTISLPKLTAKPGETVTVDVTISDVTGLNIVASDITITYDARIVTAGRLVISGTLTNRWSEAHRVGFVTGSQDTTGLIDIAVATASRIPEGSGIFLQIPFTVSDSAKIGQVSALTITEAILNNGTPAVTIVNGSITVATQAVLVGDINSDCLVDFQDFIILAQLFGSKIGDDRYNPIADFNNDGAINFSDFLIFIQNFGKTCNDIANG
ncbi:MAG: hypothetical protein ACI8V2_001394 [Candidatus Latescibacterota bacterium]|jgi:hypothetical protein